MRPIFNCELTNCLGVKKVLLRFWPGAQIQPETILNNLCRPERLYYLKLYYLKLYYFRLCYIKHTTSGLYYLKAAPSEDCIP